MKLYVIRHGETVWNPQARLQGKSDIPLNEKGLELARVTGQSLLSVDFTAAYSSPLLRAYKTAEMTLGGRPIPIYKDDRLKEIGFGVWEGKSCRPGDHEIPEEDFSTFFNDPFHFQPPQGGERIQEVCKRANEFMEEIIDKYKQGEDNILISTHGCTLRCLMNYFYKDNSKGIWRGNVPPNCAVTIVEIQGEQTKILEEDKIYYDTKEIKDYYAEGDEK